MTDLNRHCSRKISPCSQRKKKPRLAAAHMGHIGRLQLTEPPEDTRRIWVDRFLSRGAMIAKINGQLGESHRKNKTCKQMFFSVPNLG